MIKKLLATAAALAAALAMTITPAQAGHTQHYRWASLNCVKDGPNVANASGTLETMITHQATIIVTLTVNDASTRQWDWKILHDGAIEYQGGPRSGDFSVERTVWDQPYSDAIRGVAYNAARTIHCSVTVVTS